MVEDERRPNTVHRSQKNGQIVIGSAYTREMGLQPGDEFQLKLGYKHIKLEKKLEKILTKSRATPHD